MILIVGLAIGIFFVLRYADRVKKDPSKSVVYDLKAENEARFRAESDAGDVTLTGTQKTILAVFALAFVVMIYGVVPWEDIGIPFPTWWWWFPEMTASFLLFAIIIGLIGRMGEGALTTSFVDGARDLLGVALIIGIARGITVIMNNGEITDTVLHWIENASATRATSAFVIVMFLLFLPLSFVIPSIVGARDAVDADHGSARGVRRRVGRARRDRVPERLGRHEPVHPDLGRRDGRPRDRPRPLRDVPPLGLAATRDAHGSWCDRARDIGGGADVYAGPEEGGSRCDVAVDWLIIRRGRAAGESV